MGSAGTTQPHVYTTGDGGRSWKSHNLPDPPGRLLGQTITAVTVHPLPGPGVVASVAVGDGYGYEFPAYEFTSFDGGTVWTYVQLRPSQRFAGTDDYQALMTMRIRFTGGRSMEESSLNPRMPVRPGQKSRIN